MFFFGTCERFDMHIYTQYMNRCFFHAFITGKVDLDLFLHFWGLEPVTELSRCVRGRPARLFGDSECDLKIARANKIRVLQ